MLTGRISQQRPNIQPTGKAIIARPKGACSIKPDYSLMEARVCSQISERSFEQTMPRRW